MDFKRTNKANLIAFSWQFGQLIFTVFLVGLLGNASLHGAQRSVLFLILVFFIAPIWQGLTELGYFIAYKKGFHSTAEGHTYRGVSFPRFISNSADYLKKREDLTVYAKRMRLVFAFSCAFFLGVYFIVFASLLTQMNPAAAPFLLFTLLMASLVGGEIIWWGYKRVFARVFGLKIVWLENKRPFFERKGVSD
ncbi:MAG: hypothetical protein LBI11_02865 [Streptococcaceae bacterium]|jgi:hypothetical protein|nr:hypothetical protein [Streptococcaceae bacterium]